MGNLRFTIRFVRVLALLLIAPATLSAQTRRSTGYPDLDLYYSAIEENSFDALRERKHILARSVPIEHYITEFMERGFDVVRDTVCLIDFFDGELTLEREERIRAIEKIKDVARQIHHTRLGLLGDFLQSEVDEWTTHDNNLKTEEREQIMRKARRTGDHQLEAFMLFYLWLEKYFTGQPALSFKYAKRFSDALDAAGEDFPLLSRGYSWLGLAYYSHGDYERAMSCFDECFAHRDHNVHPEARLRAANYMATYHHMQGETDSAARYHRAILYSPESQVAQTAHLAIAIGDLGRIHLEEGDADQAIACLEAAFGGLNDKDYSFEAGLHTSLGETFLAKGDYRSAERQIKLAREDIDLIPGTRPLKRLQNLYSLQSRYHAGLGQTEVSGVYLDSALVAAADYERKAGQHHILLGEKALQEAQAQLAAERIDRQRNIIITIAAALLLMMVALLLIIRLYRKRNAAYKVLAAKAEKWAQKSITADATLIAQPNDTCEKWVATSEDRRIMALADREMTENHAYREQGLTLDILADRLGILRNSLSHAINRTTGGNFSNYINGYRIKEAVRIISETGRDQLYIEQIYERVGFGNRNSFYRAFRQFTGLTPVEFQKNKEKPALSSKI